MEKKLRRNQDALMISGLGVMLFAFWSIIKIIITAILDPTGLLQQLSAEVDPTFASTNIYLFLVIVILIIYFSLDLGIRLYVGLSARKEGRGQYKKNGRPRTAYIVLAFILTLLSAYMIYQLCSNLAVTDQPLDVIAALIVEITSFFTLVGMIRSAIIVRSCLNAKRKEEPANE